MVAAGMILVWAGYSVSLFGWCLMQNYDVTLGQLMSPLHPYGSGKNQPWPPPPIQDTQIWPGGPSSRKVGALGTPIATPIGLA